MVDDYLFREVLLDFWGGRQSISSINLTPSKEGKRKTVEKEQGDGWREREVAKQAQEIVGKRYRKRC